MRKTHQEEQPGKGYHDVKLRGIFSQMIFWEHGGRWIWDGLRFHMCVWKEVMIMETEGTYMIL